MYLYGGLKSSFIDYESHHENHLASRELESCLEINSLEENVFKRLAGFSDFTGNKKSHFVAI